jgi:hypothetical protein
VSDVSQPPPRAARSIRLVRSPARDGVGIFSVTAADGITFYALRELRCDIGGRGFAVHRLGHPAECSCECKGFLYRTQCRHVLGLLALVRAGLL